MQKAPPGVTDKFLLDFFDMFSLPVLLLLEEAIEKNFYTHSKDGVIKSKDWGNSSKIYLDAIKLINNNLFNTSDDNGFPKAKEFVLKYLPAKTDPNIKDIILFYIKKHTKNPMPIYFFESRRDARMNAFLKPYEKNSQ